MNVLFRNHWNLNKKPVVFLSICNDNTQDDYVSWQGKNTDEPNQTNGCQRHLTSVVSYTQVLFCLCERHIHMLQIITSNHVNMFTCFYCDLSISHVLLPLCVSSLQHQLPSQSCLPGRRSSQSMYSKYILFLLILLVYLTRLKAG